MNSKITHIIRTASALAMAAAISGCITPEQKSAYTRDELAEIMWHDNFTSKSTGISICSRDYVPVVLDKKFPVVVFLHGLGHNGNDNLSQLYEGDVGKLVFYARESKLGIVIAPQCPLGKEWADEDMLETLDGFISYILRKYSNSDPSRVMVTGFSMGGIGTYKLGLCCPTKFAALMPVCGGYRSWTEKELPQVTQDMKGLGVWSFNGINDEVVDIAYSKSYTAQLWQLDSKNVHYTESFDGHTDEKVYSSKEVLDWLFSQQKKD